MDVSVIYNCRFEYIIFQFMKPKVLLIIIYFSVFEVGYSQGTNCCMETKAYQNTSSLVAYTQVNDLLIAGANVDIRQPTGNVIVKNTDNITFQAKRTIQLKPGFIVQNGGAFKAKISPCSISPLSVTVENSLSKCGNLLNALPQGCSGNYSYIWSTGETNHSIEVFPTSDAAYTVTVLDLTCWNSVVGSITVSPDLHFKGEPEIACPNVFSPNGDGIYDIWCAYTNDVYHATYAYNSYEYELDIWDPNGNTIYEKSNSTSHIGFADCEISWNGRKNGDGVAMPDGVYYFGIKLMNCTYTNGKQFTGFMHLYGDTKKATLTIDNFDDFDEGNTSIKIYPNPIKSKSFSLCCLINDETKLISVEIYDLNGKKLKTLDYVENPLEGSFIKSYNLNEFSPGLYIIYVNKDNEVFKDKLSISE